MMETVRIRRAGYPVRRTFDDFMFRYSVLARTLGEMEMQKKCVAILQRHNTETGARDWQLGKTKVRHQRKCNTHAPLLSFQFLNFVS